MRKLLFISLFIISKFTSFSQQIGVGFYNIKQGYEFMDSTGKSLLKDCAETVGTPIDSMLSILDVVENSNLRINSLSAICVVRTTYPIINPHTEQMSDCLFTDYPREMSLGKRRFMFFYLKVGDFSKVTLMMFY